MNTLADRLKAARREAKLTQAALAEACEVSRPAIGQLEDGESVTMKAETLLRAATALRVDPYWLAFGGPNPKRVSEPAPAYPVRSDARAVLARKIKLLDEAGAFLVLNLVEYVLAMAKSRAREPAPKTATAASPVKS